jgi:transposase-like protein
MNTKRNKRNFSSEFKAKVALEALSEQFSVSELCSKYQLHPNVISNWKKELKENSKQVFGSDKDTKTVLASQEQLIADLYRKIGKLEVDNDYLKKKLGL